MMYVCAVVLGRGVRCCGRETRTRSVTDNQFKFGSFDDECRVDDGTQMRLHVAGMASLLCVKLVD